MYRSFLVSLVRARSKGVKLLVCHGRGKDIVGGKGVVCTDKRTHGYSYFLCRELENVNAESASMFIAYNLKRLIRRIGQNLTEWLSRHSFVESGFWNKSVHTCCTVINNPFLKCARIEFK